MKIKSVLFITICLFSHINAQIKLLYKSYNNKSITYIVQDLENYSIKEHNNRKIIVFPDFMDESKPGELKIPSRDIFFAIPTNSKVKVSYEILDKKILNALAELNPKVTVTKDKIVYEECIIPQYSSLKFLEVKGNLWIDENYCLHININPFQLDENNFLVHVNKFAITLSFETEIRFNPYDTIKEINELILDRQFAAKIIDTPEFDLIRNDSWIDYSKTYLKLGTGKDGIYRITYDNILALGLASTSINPKTFKLFLNGNQIPIYVKGEGDSSFDINDYIEFYGKRNMGGNHREISEFGKPYNEYLGRYTDTTVYWLTWDGDEGLRVKLQEQTIITEADTLDYYNQIDHYEKNIWLDYSTASQPRREMPFWIENKTWHDGNIGVGISNKAFTVSDVYPNKQFTMLAKLQDYASNIFQNAHKFTLSLNSTDQWSDSILINKYEQVVLKTELSSNLLQSGNNTLKINSVETSASLNACIFDWYEIEYPRYLKLENDSLEFQFPFINNKTIRNIKLSNVLNKQMIMWKNGEQYKKYLIEAKNNELIFSDTVSGKDKFLITKEEGIGSPKIYYTKKFRNLRSSENKADYITVTHKKFFQKTNEYAEFISNGYNVETIVIDVDDIYDEFAYGFFNPEAIKDFLKSAYVYWQAPKPKYVLLIGGATYDYYGDKFKNLSSVKERVINYVPSFGAPVSDSWFVTWDTTGAFVPQMNIGRLPVTTNEQLQWYMEKHRNYITQSYDDWNKRFLFFSSGDAASPAEINLLKEANQFVIDNYLKAKPVGGQYEHFYKIGRAHV